MGFWKRTGDIGVASRHVRLHRDDNGDDPVWTMLITSIMNRTLPSRTMIPGLFAAIIGLSFVIVPPALSSKFSSPSLMYRSSALHWDGHCWESFRRRLLA